MTRPPVPDDVKPGALRPGPGIDLTEPYAETPEGPIQIVGEQDSAWAAADVDPDELVDDKFISKNSEVV